MAKHKYDYRKKTSFTLEEARELIGYKARLPLTGRIVDAGESYSGPYLRFKPDERWGLDPATTLVFDVEAFDKMSED